MSKENETEQPKPSETKPSPEIPGWERDDGTHPQAQMVNTQWWRPKWGCDSLQELIELRESKDIVITALSLEITKLTSELAQHHCPNCRCDRSGEAAQARKAEMEKVYGGPMGDQIP